MAVVVRCFEFERAQRDKLPEDLSLIFQFSKQRLTSLCQSLSSLAPGGREDERHWEQDWNK